MQISQEAGQVVWYSHLFQNFPQFIVIHTVKGFGIVGEVVKQEMARVNVDILGISELKWTGMECVSLENKLAFILVWLTFEFFLT